MRTPVLVSAAAVVALGVLAGCGAASSDPSGSPSASGTPPESTPSVPEPTPSGPTGPDPSGRPTTPPPINQNIPEDLASRPAVRKALDDAAGRVGIVPARIVIAGYALVTWNDGSLGCPQPGKSSTQGTVDGQMLLLRSDQRLMAYHAAGDGPFRYCATPDGSFTVRSG